MPLTTLGEGFRVFSEPTIFEAETEAQVQQIEIPVDKAFAFVAADNGFSNFELWKFDAASAAAAGASVLVPNNPLFATLGRWIKIPIGGGGGSGTLTIIGSGSPEGVQIADPGQWYWDNDPLPTGQALYLKLTGIDAFGWLQTMQFGE